MNKLRVRVLFAASAALLFFSGCFGSGDNKSSAEHIVLPKVTAPVSFKNALFPAGDGKAVCPKGLSIAYVGIVTGPNAAFGKSINEAFQLAVKQHNDNNPGCQVTGKVFDTEGSPDKAPGVVAQVIGDSSIVAVLGPAFSGENQAVGGIFETARLVHITPSATLPTLSSHGWKTFFRAASTDLEQSTGVIALLEKLEAKKTFVVSDDSAYGKFLGDLVKKGVDLAGSDGIITGSRDFSSVVAKVVSSGADSVFFAGYYPEAAAFFTQLRGAGFNGYLVVPDGSLDRNLSKLAGQAAVGVYAVCPCTDDSQVAGFGDAMKKAYGHYPGIYSSSAYDVTTILLRGIDSGRTSRSSLLDWVRGYDAYGVSGHYKFKANGDLQHTPLYFYRFDESGAPVLVGEYSK
ncbi:branched-chain amino acid ABC transporter substrate-binding protein [Tropheryma whipplei]|uniref:branched-chain amino acid ABC transporter substrate-binding protein n=1 Tax=Tropheryma whipplei TaxID=2039 RepID=UPI0004B15E5C|nr:branched-chain amino acid ABC transporter substrate-binding protein [Tropheryma whipplei]